MHDCLDSCLRLCLNNLLFLWLAFNRQRCWFMPILVFGVINVFALRGEVFLFCRRSNAKFGSYPKFERPENAFLFETYNEIGSNVFGFANRWLIRAG